MFKENKLLSLVFREKPTRVLISLGDKTTQWYASLLAKTVDCTYPHIIKILKALEEMKLIETKAAGRKKFVTATPKGQDLAHDLEGLVRHMNNLLK